MNEFGEMAEEVREQALELSAVSGQETECAATLSKESAAKILREVSFTKGLIASEYSIKGISAIRIRSLMQTNDFLDKCNTQFHQDASQVSQNTAMYHLDLHILACWIKESLGDDVLAADINNELGGKCASSLVSDMSTYYREHIGPVKDLVEKRLEQCKEVLKEDIESK